MDTAAVTGSGAINWPIVITDLIEANDGWRGSTRDRHESNARNFLALFDGGAATPVNARQVFKAYADRQFTEVYPRVTRTLVI